MINTNRNTDMLRFLGVLAAVIALIVGAYVLKGFGVEREKRVLLEYDQKYPGRKLTDFVFH
jgi:hypothetical protein